MKICKKCNILKENNEFYIYKNRIWNICKKCIAKQSKKRYKENKQTVLNNNKKNKNKLKQCTKCKQKKEIVHFRKDNGTKDGISMRCKCCLNEYKKQYRLQNKEKNLIYRKKYYEKNVESILERAKIARETDFYKKYKKEYLEKNKDALIEYRKKYYEENKIEIQAKAKQYTKKDHSKNNRSKYYQNKRKNDACFKLACNLRTRIRKALKRNSKSSKSTELTGCTIQELKIYIEGKFQKGMSWENYAYDTWHIDHIRPCASFDLSDHEQQKLCFHYTNLQPLWAYENLSKSDKYDLN